MVTIPQTVLLSYSKRYLEYGACYYSACVLRIRYIQMLPQITCQVAIFQLPTLPKIVLSRTVESRNIQDSPTAEQCIDRRRRQQQIRTGLVLVRKEIQILSHATITPMGLAASLAFTEERFPIVSNGRTVICLSRQTAATSTCMSMNESEKDVAFIVRKGGFCPPCAE